MNKKINPKTFEWHQDISDTVEELLSEVKDLAVGGQIAILPLAACATMVGSSSSVWHCMFFRTHEIVSLANTGYSKFHLLFLEIWKILLLKSRLPIDLLWI